MGVASIQGGFIVLPVNVVVVFGDGGLDFGAPKASLARHQWLLGGVNALGTCLLLTTWPEDAHRPPRPYYLLQIRGRCHSQPDLVSGSASHEANEGSRLKWHLGHLEDPWKIQEVSTCERGACQA